jgi:threonine dehydratase
LIEDAGDLDAIVAPVGGGGLLSGTAIAARSLLPGIRVLGAEPALADDAHRSLREGRRIPLDRTSTIADGLRTSLGTLTFPILLDLVDEILLATEEEILAAMRLVWERMKIVAEPSAAVPLAALLRREGNLEGKRLGVILSGGNVDPEALPFRPTVRG